MALETVQIKVQDDQIVPQLVDGVVVRVFDQTGTTLITEGTTGSVIAGTAEFTLNGDNPAITYQLRFYINGGSVLSPQYIQVYSPPSAAPPPGGNTFTITAALFTLPTATNPLLCRVSGFIWGPDGRPKRGIDIAFIPLFRPLVVGEIGVLGERVNTKTDKDGFVQVDLLREGCYFASVESHENVQRDVEVPDRSSVNIMHLLFPIVVKIAYGVIPPIAVPVDGLVTLTPVITASDFRTLEGTAPEDVQYAVDDPSVASVVINQNTIVINGLSAGTTNLRVTRKDASIIYLPDPGIDGAVVQITVA
jgi:hypothetical protein